MVYTHGDYTLHCKEITLKSTGKKQMMYFFCKNMPPKSGEPCDKPDGYSVGVNRKTGLPYLTKK